MLRELAQGRSIDEVLMSLAEGRRVYAPQAGAGDQFHLAAGDGWVSGTHALAPYRPIESVKSLFFRPRENLGSLFGTTAPQTIGNGIVFGVKNCDLCSLSLHDAVFRDSDPPDPFYSEMRARTLVVSCDCTACLDVCFCTAVGDGPYPDGGFDINISPLPSGYVFASGSTRGEAALMQIQHLLADPSDALLAERDAERKRMRETVAEQAARHGLTGDQDYRRAVAGTADSGLWEDFAETASNAAPATSAAAPATVSCWPTGLRRERDRRAGSSSGTPACSTNFAARGRAAATRGGRRAERLHNRFDKKFSLLPGGAGRLRLRRVRAVHRSLHREDRHSRRAEEGRR